MQKYNFWGQRPFLWGIAPFIIKIIGLGGGIYVIDIKQIEDFAIFIVDD